MSNDMRGAKGLTRRQVLGMLGAGAAALALAACQTTPPAVAPTTAANNPPAQTSGQPTATAATTQQQPGTNQGGTDTKKGGEFHWTANYELPPVGHFNQYIPKTIGNFTAIDFVEAPLAFYIWKTQKYTPALAEKWEMQGDNFTVTLRKGAKWSDDKPVTSKDVVASFIMARLYNYQLFKYVDKVEAKDELTVNFHMSKPSHVVPRYVLRTKVGNGIHSAATYGEWADKAAKFYDQGKDNNSDELKQLRTDFEKVRPDNIIASGPYMIDPKSITEASLTLVKNPKSWAADKVRFDSIKLYQGETPVITPLVLSKDVDYATHGFPPATDQQFQAQGIRVLRPPSHNGPAIQINYASPKMKPLTDKRVRQALAYAVKRDDNAFVSLAKSAKAQKYMTGISDSMAEQWVNEPDLKKLNQYPYDTKKAEELMTAAGCKKGGDGWIGPDGQPMAYELIVPAEYADWSGSAQDWADQVTKFGIKITIRAITFTQVPIERREGRFELAYDSWGSGNPIPHFSFVSTVMNKVQPLALGPYTSYSLKQKTDVVGDVDFEQLITATGEGTDDKVQKDNVTKTSLAYNEVLLNIPIWEKFGNNPALEGVRVKAWPPDSDPLYENDYYNDSFVIMWIYDGTLGPV